MRWWLAYNALGQLTCLLYTALTGDWMPTYSWALGFVSGFLGARLSSYLTSTKKG